MGKAVSKLSKEDIKSLRNATYFDKRELPQWYKGFLRDCPSGKLSEEEFIKIFKQFFPFGDPSAYCHYLFKVFDVDDLKFIDFKEFIVTLSITSRGTADQKLNWAFKLYDQNRKNKIDYNDVLLITSSIYQMIGSMVNLPEDEKSPELRVEKQFKLMGKSTDEYITLDEFKKLPQLEPSIGKALNAYEGWV